MATTLEKIRRLEQYLSGDASVDPVLDSTIDKLLAREIAQARDLKTRLQNQLSEFESQYDMASDVFHKKYQRGELGDEMDFVEWSSTIDMLNEAEKRLALLDVDSET